MFNSDVRLHDVPSVMITTVIPCFHLSYPVRVLDKAQLPVEWEADRAWRQCCDDDDDGVNCSCGTGELRRPRSPEWTALKRAGWSVIVIMLIDSIVVLSEQEQEAALLGGAHAKRHACSGDGSGCFCHTWAIQLLEVSGKDGQCSNSAS